MKWFLAVCIILKRFFHNITVATLKGIGLTRELLLEKYGRTSLIAGMPSRFSSYEIPSALRFHAKGPWGILCLQEVKTHKYFLRHFLFFLKEKISFCIEEESTRLQSLLNIAGRLDFQITGRERLELKEREYLLFATSGKQTLTTIHEGHNSLLNAQYTTEFYRDFYHHFVGLKDDLRKAAKEPHYFSLSAQRARNSIHESINAIWEEKYIPSLQAINIQLRLESSLFSMLAQSYPPDNPGKASRLERTLATQAKKLILKDLGVHLTPEEIASQLNCSASWLRKAFRKVYGVPMYNFLRSKRMNYAKRKIEAGMSLKEVSIELGMNPSNFPKEFKAFFGYTVTSLKKGLS